MLGHLIPLRADAGRRFRHLCRECLKRLPRSIRDAWHLLAAPSLYGRERVMRVRWQIDFNTVAGADLTPIQDNRHDAGFANDSSLDVTIQCRGHQACALPSQMRAPKPPTEQRAPR